ncbi:helix-turn-helix domain-containing protein [Streptosporangium sp. NPDC000509]|uniref:helix-turn-helix domain-containing protein n=1 Tax=Streptosporangium sp. NPDC000509 TaxID=3366186 RepID=UPI00368D7D8E
MVLPAQRALVPLDSVLGLLDLLLDETADEQSAVAPLAESLDGVELAGVLRRTRRVRAALARWRRRDQELSALLSSARELAELRDLDALLDRLVARAHGLVGTDVTYLSEFDQETDELRVRSTLGTFAPEFRRLRVPPGKGLAGKVVSTRSPQWTTNYDHYLDVPHDAEIDEAVRAEGLVSLLGVPLVAGDRVLGVLFAANRDEHAFTPEEIVLLSAFADHAAVVLQTVHLLAQARASAEAARAANEDLARTMAARERASAVHQDLTNAVLRGGTAHEVARTLAASLGRSVEIFDRDLAPLASARTDASRESSPVTAHVRAAVERSRTTGRCVFLDPSDDGASVVVAVVAAETLLGAILVGHGDLALGSVERRTIERAAQIVALLALKREAVAEAEERVRGELISDILLGDGTHREELMLRARARGVRLESLRMVVAVLVPRDRRRAAVQALGTWRPGLLAGEHAGCVVVLTDAADPDGAATEVRECVRPLTGPPVLVVADAPVATWGELGARFEPLRQCADLLHGMGIQDTAVNAAAYQPYLALFGAGRDGIVAFTEAVLGPVLRWDRDHSTDLVKTLRTYIDSHCSPARAARALNMHINTVNQRLDRITLLLGPPWREPEPFFRVTVAVRMHALATGL